MATISSVSLATPSILPKASDSPKLHHSCVNMPWKSSTQAQFLRARSRIWYLRPVAAAPDSISDKVAESIKNAEEACSGDATSGGECAAAWDEVEELSAAASHARDKKKLSPDDPLENYCKDNPETDECRTYDN